MIRWTLKIALLLSIVSVGMALAGDRADTAKSRYEEVTREIQVKKKKHEDLEKQEKSLLDHMDRLAFEVDRKNRELRSAEEELRETEKAMAQHERAMRHLRDQMTTTQACIEKRVAALYRISKTGPWAFLLSAEDYGDFLRMLRFLSSMVDHDVVLLTTFEEQINEREALQKKLAAYEDQLEEKQRQARLKKREMQQVQKRKRRTLREVREARASFASILKDLEEQAEELESMIDTLSSEHGERHRSTSGFQGMKGRLLLPLGGETKPHAETMRRGICFKAPMGTIVRSVYKGRVAYAGWFKGYGNLLIIDHGDKFHTVMAHASELLKGENDWVEAGEPVAKVGSTGTLGGPSLYFELRHSGMPLNPLDWFSQEQQLVLK
jgi:septal ring factor EnvC (AmiA/AmiB activator)